MGRLFVVMLKIFTFVLCVALTSATCGPQETMVNQGKKLCCYNDTRGVPTIGIGFQLKRNDATTVMAVYNLTVSNILKDCEKNTTNYCLTNDQAEDIFNRITYPEVEACVDRYVPNLPTMTRAAVVDMAFGGCGALNELVQMKKALEDHNWKQAAEELRNSVWCTKVKERRCNLDYNCILNDSYSDQLYSSTMSNCSLNSECYYYKTFNGKKFSISRIQCSHFPNCNYCSFFTSVCIIDSCCIEPICVPLSLNGTCTSISTDNLPLFNLQLSLNRTLETINRKLTTLIMVFSLIFVLTLFLFLPFFIKRYATWTWLK